jgi:hypothetical protein
MTLTLIFLFSHRYLSEVNPPAAPSGTQTGSQPTIGSKNLLIFIFFVHRYLPDKKRT